MSVKKEYIMGIDSGTQNCRAVIFDRQGNPVGKGASSHKPYFSLEPGWAEQDPEDFWEKLRLAIRESIDQSSIKKEKIIGVGIATHRGTMILVSEDGQPLRQAIGWLDQRRAEGLRVPTGFPENLAPLMALSKPNWVKVNEPEIYQRAYKFLTVCGWLTYKLTGQYKDSVGMQAGVWPFDIEKLDWFEQDVMFEGFGAPREKLPEIYPPGTILGYVTKKAAQETGLPEGIPVAAGAGDKQCEALGSGATKPGSAAISYGTAAVIGVTSRECIRSPTLEYFTWPSSVPRAWNLEFFLPRGYWTVSWFKKEFAYPEVLEAQRRGLAPEDILNQEASKIPAGSEGLVLQPYWSPHMGLAPFGRGTMLGFTDVHSRAHVYRAIIEGVAYAIKDGITILERALGFSIDDVRISGGGAKSDLAMQITADILGLSVKRPHTTETSALGAAIDAAKACGLYDSVEQAAECMTGQIQTFNPIPENQIIYNRLYKEVYKKIYPSLEDIYKKIKDIVG